MTELVLQIYRAREAGYSDEEILGYLCLQNVRGLSPYLRELRRAGYDAPAILQYLEMSMIISPAVHDAFAARDRPAEPESRQQWIN